MTKQTQRDQARSASPGTAPPHCISKRASRHLVANFGFLTPLHASLHINRCGKHLPASAMSHNRSLTTSFLLLLLCVARASSKNIWHVSIFQGPAPPPGKGAPIQASALRDKSYLPAQIAAIVSSYVFSVVVIGAALLFVGRRLRRAAQASPKTLSMEMMRPVKTDVPKAFDPSPISHGASPNSAAEMKRFWHSPAKELRGSDGWGSKKGHSRQMSESQASVVTFDESVIEDDKARNEREMERLYAAVMEEDEKRSRSNSKVNLPAQHHPQYPPELQHLRDTNTTSVPPRTDTKSPARTLTKSPANTSTRPTPLSLHSRNSSRSSLGSYSKRGVRGLPISPPMGSPGIAADYDDGYGDGEPLTPRQYTDPGPPPPTPDEVKIARQRHEYPDNERLSPRDARFPMTTFRKGGSVPQSPAVQTIHEVDSRAELQSRNSERSNTSKAPRALPGTLPLRAHATNGKSQSQNTLPLRGSQPTSPNFSRPEPSPSIKATVLESKPKNRTLRTPGTGAPMTPYSPYMPYTPLTPMTPSRLVTREERKRKVKEEGRRVPTIEDAVEEEADMWGSAYP